MTNQLDKVAQKYHELVAEGLTFMLKEMDEECARLQSRCEEAKAKYEDMKRQYEAVAGTIALAKSGVSHDPAD